MRKLSFDYGYVLTDAGVHFEVNIYSNASANPVLMKTITIHNSEAAKLTPYHYEEEVNMNMNDLMIEVKPLSPTQSTTNRDRFAIWNITWEPA